MLKVRVELWPGGNHLRASTLAEMEIWNDSTGTEEVGNYCVTADEAPSAFSAGLSRDAFVRGHARKQPVLVLLHAALSAMFQEQSPTER